MSPFTSQKKGCKLPVHCHGDRAETGLPEKPGGTNHCNRPIYTGDLHDTLRTDTHITAPLSLCSVSIKGKNHKVGKDEAVLLRQ